MTKILKRLRRSLVYYLRADTLDETPSTEESFTCNALHERGKRSIESQNDNSPSPHDHRSETFFNHQ